jgi:hypothetical protein
MLFGHSLLIYKLCIKWVVRACKVLLLGLASLGALATLPCLAAGYETLQTLSASPKEGERLSDWLLRQPPHADAYPLGLHW